MVYRRYKRKRHYRNKPKKLTKYALQKLINGQKIYRNELNFHVFSAHAQVKFHVITPLMCYDHGYSILNSAGQEGSLGSPTDSNIRYKIINVYNRYHIRNVSNHPCFIKFYECVLRNDYNIDSTTNTETAIDDYAMTALVHGWDIDMQAAQVTDAGTGTVVDFTAGNNSCTSTVKALTPYLSSTFCEKFKVLKAVGGKMLPGEDYYYKMQTKGFVWNAAEMNDANTQRKEGIGGITKILLVKLHGVLGKDTVDDSKIGWCATDIGMEIMQHAQVIKLDSDDRQLHIGDSHHTVTNVEAGTDYVMTQDDQ